ncbi:MAG TPA: GAF domain-containing protein [Candidatus Eisenbacteria bacterium]|nr:GAF domain-containing protein [Candidatus Eisenbacteria bacterium]
MTRAGEVLGVHPNTVRAWSEAGRLRFYRINPRGDRRYRMSDLRRFLASTLAVEIDRGGQALKPLRPRRHGDATGNGRPRIESRRNSTLSIKGASSSNGAASSATAAGAAASAEPALALLADLAGIVAAVVRPTTTDAGLALGGAAHAIRKAGRFVSASAWQLHGDRLTPVAASGVGEEDLVELPRSYGILGLALDVAPDVADPDPVAGVLVAAHGGRESACAIPGPGGPWGVLLIVHDPPVPLSEVERQLLRRSAEAVGHVAEAAATSVEVAHRLHRADALRRVAADIGSHLDLEELLSRLTDHALVLFGADRAMVYLLEPDGAKRAMASRGLSQSWIDALEHAQPPTLGSTAIAARRPIFAVDNRNDPRTGNLRAAVVQEGFDTACLAPLLDGDAPGALGVLGVYHDRPHPWSPAELESIAALATEAGVAIKTARNYAQLATWAAQLQSIQQLGTRLNRMTRVSEVGHAIATELRQLIDYHNVRVYRLYGETLEPVAMLGQVGEYVDETPDQLRATLGAGITGWVAEHRVAQLLDDAASDPRGTPIPGTDRLEESMILAPMLYEDEVLGVVVLSKLGLRQFHPDDLRLLEIYASFAAQAMANADATQRLREQSAALEQKVRGQRELLQLSESILTTFDVSALLEVVADRLGELVGSDTVAIDVIDAAGELVPTIARGAAAQDHLRAGTPDRRGLEQWVLDHNIPQRIEDRLADARTARPGERLTKGSVLCVPLRGRRSAIGVVVLERVGADRVFSEDEFELVQLFAAQVSVALQNAESHRAVERRAQTDTLTGLFNFGSFSERLAGLVTAGDPFSLVMLDLDGFKRVNDAYGHQAGDRLLRQVARALETAGRDTDDVFRYGGDEFTVLLPGTDELHALAVAERVRAAVRSVVIDRSPVGGAAVTVDAAAGVASFPVDGGSPVEILLAADRACFVAKRSGGGRTATAAEGLALAGELTLQAPTPIDPLPHPAS